MGMSRASMPFGGRLRGSRPELAWCTASPRRAAAGSLRRGSPTLASASDRSVTVGDEMDDLALALDAAADGQHAGRKDHPALLLEHFGQTMRLAMPVSSSMVMNITPWRCRAAAAPARCRRP